MMKIKSKQTIPKKYEPKTRQQFAKYIFEQLKKIYKISDQLIIPLITDKFLPYLEKTSYKIIIYYNELPDLNDISDIADFVLKLRKYKKISFPFSNIQLM